MGIDVVIETENGEAEDQVPDLQDHLAIALNMPGLENTVCLRFIDPYGNTVFNRAQVPVFIAELEALTARITDSALRQEAVRNFEGAKEAGWAEEIVRRYESAIDRVTSGPIRAHLHSVLELARKANGEVHLYLKFYGD